MIFYIFLKNFFFLGENFSLDKEFSHRKDNFMAVWGVFLVWGAVWGIIFDCDTNLRQEIKERKSSSREKIFVKKKKLLQENIMKNGFCFDRDNRLRNVGFRNNAGV